jgi:recombination protein RecT
MAAETGTAVAAVKQQKALTLRSLLEKHQGQIALALPNGWDVKRFNRIAFSAAVNNPVLLDCDPKSFLSAVIKSAQLGLALDDGRGQGFIVPFYNNRARRMDAQFIPGYKGLIDLAYKSPKVLDFNVGLVFENEEKEAREEFRKGEAHFSERPSVRGLKRIAAYAIVKLVGGGIVKYWMWDEEIMEIRDKSSSYIAYKAGKIRSCIWEDNPDWMWKKCPIRQIAKLVPSATELQIAVGIEEHAEATGAPVREFFIDEKDMESYMEEQAAGPAIEATTAKTEELKGKLDGLKSKEAHAPVVGETTKEEGGKKE